MENEVQDIIFKDIIEFPGLAGEKHFFINTANGRWVTLDHRECQLFQVMKTGAAEGHGNPNNGHPNVTRLEYKLEAAGLIRSTGIPRKQRLMELQLGITSACNLECIHCLGGNNNEPGVERKQFMSLSLIEKVLSEAQIMGVETISLTGGEPFLHPSIRDIIKLVTGKKFKNFSIATNGIKLTGEIIRFLADHHVSLNLSCDSINKSTYELIRINAEFTRFLKTIAALKKTTLNVALNFTINRLNRDEIADFFNWAAEHHFKYIQFSTLLPLGRGGENYSSLRVSDEALRETWENILGLKRMYRGSVKVRELELLRERIRYGHRNSCAAGIKVAYIDPLGRLFPCHFLQQGPALNMENTLLPEAWQHAPNITTMRELRVSDIPGCSSCSFKAICGGGCRAGLAHLRAFPIYCPKEIIINLIKEEQ